MSDPLHKTRGIVLRTVKYGETSLIVTVFTERFGLQSYLVNGVRTASKKGSGRANLFQPAAILDLVVYHNELKQLNRIREFRWGVIYDNLYQDVPRHAIAQFMLELLTRCLKQPESHPELYHFTEECLLQLDNASPSVMANFPLFFALQLPFHFGFRISDNHQKERTVLDWQEGSFVSVPPGHDFYEEGATAGLAAQLLRVMHPHELAEIKSHQLQRRHLLSRLEAFYALHVSGFGKMKTVKVLEEVLG